LTWWNTLQDFWTMYEKKKRLKLKIHSEYQSWGPGHISRKTNKLCKGYRFWVINRIHNLILLAIRMTLNITSTKRKKSHFKICSWINIDSEELSMLMFVCLHINWKDWIQNFRTFDIKLLWSLGFRNRVILLMLFFSNLLQKQFWFSL